MNSCVVGARSSSRVAVPAWGTVGSRLAELALTARCGTKRDGEGSADAWVAPAGGERGAGGGGEPSLSRGTSGCSIAEMGSDDGAGSGQAEAVT